MTPMTPDKQLSPPARILSWILGAVFDATNGAPWICAWGEDPLEHQPKTARRTTAIVKMFSRSILLATWSILSLAVCAENHRFTGLHHQHSLPAIPRGGGVPKPSSATATPTSITKNGTSSIPVFFRTKTALQLFGFSLLSFGAPYLLAPKFTHSMLFTADLNDTSFSYERLFAMRELLLSLISLLMVYHPQASEGLRRWYMLFSAAILPPLQLHLLLSKKDLWVNSMKIPMRFMMVFYELYLCFSAYLSWKCDQRF